MTLRDESDKYELGDQRGPRRSWRADQQPPRSDSRWQPLKADHPSVGQICPACNKPLKEGDVPTLVTVGPGDDEEARERAREGRAYTAVAIVAHERCVTG